MQNFKFDGVTVLAVQLFNHRYIAEEEEDKATMKRHVSLYFQDVMSNHTYLLLKMTFATIFCIVLRH